MWAQQISTYVLSLLHIKHYNHERNNHANATEAKKYIKHYRKKKPSLKNETTKNEG